LGVRVVGATVLGSRSYSFGLGVTVLGWKPQFWAGATGLGGSTGLGGLPQFWMVCDFTGFRGLSDLGGLWQFWAVC